MKSGDPARIDLLHDWAEAIVNHSRRVHKVARFLGIKEQATLHDIEEVAHGTLTDTGKFSPPLFRAFSPEQVPGEALDRALAHHRASLHHSIFIDGLGWDDDVAMFSGVDWVVAAMESRHYGRPHRSMAELRAMANGLEGDHREYVHLVLDRIDQAGPRGFHGVFTIVQTPQVKVERYRIYHAEEVLIDAAIHVSEHLEPTA